MTSDLVNNSWLVVVYPPLWKMMEFVNWDDEIFPIFMGKCQIHGPTSYHQPASAFKVPKKIIPKSSQSPPMTFGNLQGSIHWMATWVPKYFQGHILAELLAHRISPSWAESRCRAEVARETVALRQVRVLGPTSGSVRFWWPRDGSIFYKWTGANFLLDPHKTSNLRIWMDLRQLIWRNLSNLSKVKALRGPIDLGKAWILRNADKCWPCLGVNCEPFCRTKFEDKNTSGNTRNESSQSSQHAAEVYSQLIVDDHQIISFNSGFMNIAWLIGRATVKKSLPNPNQQEVIMETAAMPQCRNTVDIFGWYRCDVTCTHWNLWLPGKKQAPSPLLRTCFYTHLFFDV